ncbi:MAG: NAD(+)/NADH kinase [Anaerolineales bacterium]
MIAHSIKHVAIAYHPDIVEATLEAANIAAFLEKSGIQSYQGLISDQELAKRLIAKEFDLLISLGGDGTMLRAGRLCGPIGVPILGINLGRFGFLMEVRQKQWKDYLPLLIKGNFWLEERMMLRAQQWRAGVKLGEWEAINEAVVCRGKTVLPVHLDTSVDGRFLTTYVADGLIAATPTGSTAYALAAGGPILPPELRNILIVPVAPHLSIDRAIVLSEGSAVSITIQTNHNAVLSIDGQPPTDLETKDCVEVCAGDHTVHFVRFQDPGYFYRNLTPHMSQNPSIGIQK